MRRSEKRKKNHVAGDPYPSSPETAWRTSMICWTRAPRKAVAGRTRRYPAFAILTTLDLGPWVLRFSLFCFQISPINVVAKPFWHIWSRGLENVGPFSAVSAPISANKIKMLILRFHFFGSTKPSCWIFKIWQMWKTFVNFCWNLSIAADFEAKFC